MTPTATDWLVRTAGDPTPRPVAAPAAVLEGLREGDWDTTDEVRGPGERMWVPIEEHPAFADAVAEMGPPPPEPVDDFAAPSNSRRRNPTMQAPQTPNNNNYWTARSQSSSRWTSVRNRW
jgi:hypothetical protein